MSFSTSLTSPDTFANVYQNRTSQLISDFQEALSKGKDQNISWPNWIDLEPISNETCDKSAAATLVVYENALMALP